MEQTEEILELLRNKQNIMVVSDSQQQLELLFDRLCKEGYGSVTMPIFEAEYSKRELARELGQCMTDVHRERMPLGKNILDMKQLLDSTEGELVQCVLPYVEQLTEQEVKDLTAVLEEYQSVSKNINNEEQGNSWEGLKLQECSDELMGQLNELFPKILSVLEKMNDTKTIQYITEGSYLAFNWKNIESFLSLFEKALRLQKIPVDWMYQVDFNQLSDQAQTYRKQCQDYRKIQEALSRKYNQQIFELSGIETERILSDGMNKLKKTLRLQVQKEGFILDNVRHFASRADALFRDLYQVQHDMSVITELTGGSQNVTLADTAQYYEMSNLLENKEEGLEWIKSHNNTATKEINETEPEFTVEVEMSREQKCIADLSAALQAVNSVNLPDGGMLFVRSVYEMEHNLALCRAVLGDMRPCEAWLENRQMEYIVFELEECEKQCLAMKRISYEILEEYKEDILQIPCEEMLSKFKYTYQTMIGRIKGNYKQDKERIRNALRIQRESFTDEEAIRVLEMLCMLQEKRIWLREKKVFLVENIGSYYHGENTNWGIVKEDMKQFEALTSFFETAQEAYGYIMRSKDEVEKIQQCYENLIRLKKVLYEEATEFFSEKEIGTNEIERLLSDLKLKVEGNRTEKTVVAEEKEEETDGRLFDDTFLAFLQDDTRKFQIGELFIWNYQSRLPKIKGELKSFLLLEELENYKLSQLLTLLEHVKTTCIAMDGHLTRIRELCNRREHADILYEDVKQVALMQQIEHEFKEDKEEKCSEFGKLYQGVVTDWNEICEQIRLAQSLKTDVSKYHLSRACLEIILDAEQHEIDLYQLMEQLSGVTVYEKEFMLLDHLFEKNSSLQNIEFGVLYEKLKNCYNTLGELNEWMEYQNVKKKCEKYGLLSFVAGAEQMKIAADQIQNSFIRTFYEKRLTHAMERKGEQAYYFVKSMAEIQEMQNFEESKQDIRKMEIEDYLVLVPLWLSRCKNCLLMKGEAVESSYYKIIKIQE